MEDGGDEEGFVLILLLSSTNVTLYLDGSLHMLKIRSIKYDAFVFEDLIGHVTLTEDTEHCR